MDSFSKYLKYKNKYLNLLNKMLQHGGKKCSNCTSEISSDALICVNCGHDVSSDVIQQESLVVPEQGSLLEMKEDEPDEENEPTEEKIRDKRMKMTKQLLDNADLSKMEPKNVQEITELDQPEFVVDIMKYASGESPEEIHKRLMKTMKFIEDDEYKIKFNFSFQPSYASGITYVSLLPNGFALGGVKIDKCDCGLFRDVGCECDDHFVWVQFTTQRKLSEFIIANCIFVEEIGTAIRTGVYTQTSSFLEGENRDTVVNKMKFEDDLPKDLNELSKHPLVLYAEELGRISGDFGINFLIDKQYESDENP